ncbi:hypothetical protein FA09DRAFT_327249 [Tilletiopsis washingtonensis]|uniref:Uncharacterized protein n=1 Tax=Tilletiopsis washingtonensis TaxID=58919 RepID=A0A316ZIE2_9BASI|nr:hypothetical protein FA09DRAFT_327249 [Tilletiopsis washingtonensis]PWO01302.1 hypothetical protein FA09DRAFT_327249 [Tilletiopsis washingtonensis]
MEQQSNPSGSASAGPSKRASSTSASPTKRPRLASASSRVLALQASSSFSLALASSSPSPQWYASFLFLPTSSGILLVHPLRREQRHLLPLAAPRFFCVAPSADAVFAANERGAKVWTRAPATQCGNAWTEHVLPTSSVRGGGGVKEARWCGEPGKWAHASSSTTSTFATSFRRTLPSGPQAATSRALLLVLHSGHVLLVRLPDAQGASGTAAGATLEVLQATLERPSVVRRGEEEEVKPLAPTTDREMVREVSICALPGESTFLIAYNLAPSLVSTSSLSSAPHLGASLDPSTTTSAASPDASAAAALLAVAQSTATPAAARTPFAAALGGAAGTALAGDGDEGKGKGQVRFCEVRISLGGEETEEVYLSTRPLASLSLNPTSSPSTSLFQPSSLLLLSPSPSHDSSGALPLLLLASDGASLRSWSVKRETWGLSEAFAQLGGKESGAGKGEQTDWSFVEARQKDMQVASMMANDGDVWITTNASLLHRLDAATFETSSTTSLPPGMWRHGVAISPNGVCAAGVDARLHHNAQQRRSQVRLFPLGTRREEEAGKREEAAAASEDVGVKEENDKDETTSQERSRQAGQALALCLLNRTDANDVVLVHQLHTPERIASALRATVQALHLAASPSVTEPLRVLQLNAALCNTRAVAGGAERCNVVLRLADVVRTLGAARRGSTAWRLDRLIDLTRASEYTFDLCETLARQAVLVHAKEQVYTPESSSGEQDRGSHASASANAAAAAGQDDLLSLFALSRPRLLLQHALKHALSLRQLLLSTSDEARREALLDSQRSIFVSSSSSSSSTAAGAQGAGAGANGSMASLIATLDSARALVRASSVGRCVQAEEMLDVLSAFEAPPDSNDDMWFCLPGLRSTSREATVQLAHALLGASASIDSSSPARRGVVRDLLPLLISPHDVLDEASALAPLLLPRASRAGEGAAWQAKESNVLCLACGEVEKRGERRCVCGGEGWRL